MKRRGFTLIELLAVIVVLAVIALIATPIVMNVIENSKMGTAKDSAYNLIRSAEMYFMRQDIRYGLTDVNNENLKYDGKRPEVGQVEVDKEGNTRIYVYIDGYCATKEKDEEEIYVSKTTKESCNWYATSRYSKITTDGSILTMEESKKVVDYKIYGNSYQATRSGKNLFDINNVRFSAHNAGYINNYGSKVEGDKVSCGGIIGSAGGSMITLEVKENTTYTISFDVSGAVSNGEFTAVDNLIDDVWGDKLNLKAVINISAGSRVEETVTIPSGYKYLVFIMYSNKKYGVQMSNIQVEEGTVATAYEPYGKMPSEGFPSTIQSLGVYNETTKKYEIPIKVTGKNLFDLTKSNFENGVDYGDGKKIELLLKPNTTYTLSSNAPKYDEYGTNIWFNGSNSGSSGVWNGQIRSVTTDDSGKLFVAIRSSELDNIFNNYWIQLEEGSVATEYEPYKEKTYTIYLDEPLRCKGNVCDYIDYSNGQVVRNIEQIDYSGEKNIEESFNLLTTPIYEKVDLPNIDLLDGVNNITVSDGNLFSSKIELTVRNK